MYYTLLIYPVLQWPSELNLSNTISSFRFRFLVSLIESAFWCSCKWDPSHKHCTTWLDHKLSENLKWTLANTRLFCNRKLFCNEVWALEYMYDQQNPSKQYLLAVGLSINILIDAHFFCLVSTKHSIVMLYLFYTSFSHLCTTDIHFIRRHPYSRIRNVNLKWSHASLWKGEYFEESTLSEYVIKTRMQLLVKVLLVEINRINCIKCQILRISFKEFKIYFWRPLGYAEISNV